MKRRNIFHLGLGVALALCFQAAVWASSIDYRGNQSGEYIRTLSRNASLDAADIVNYNPAGTAFLEDGLHFNGSLQFMFKNYQMEDSNETYKSDKPSLFVPALYAVYKKNNWAAFTGFSLTGGGGSVNFKDGIAALAAFTGYQDGNVKARSLYYGLTVGGAYAVSEMLSFSLGARYIFGERKYDVEANIGGTTLELDTTQTAQGVGAVFGVDFKPNKQLNIGLRYESKTKLKFENDTEKNDFSTFLPAYAIYDDGVKRHRDLPALLSGGVAYEALPGLTCTFSVTYYMIKQANSDDAYDDYNNGWDVGGSIEYYTTPELLLSVGYMYSISGANEDTVNDFDMTLDAHNTSFGIRYALKENLKLSLGYIYSKYIDQENEDGSVEYRKAVHTVAVGVDYKAF
jgi:long-chain fatty acid transport protein